MFLLRDVQKSDLEGLQKLASVLNSVNLPDNEQVVEQLIDVSIKSFTGRLKAPFEREYLFVLEDQASGQLLGTSMVMAQHGTFDTPHIYFQVTEAEHYSATLEKHFKHKVLSMGYNYHGPTEIGGLVVQPSHRSGPDKIGKQLSYVRFLYMAMHRKHFRDRVLAELLPPLMADGRSWLWESCGKKFTGLDYPTADRLSRQNKEFIKELFPSSDIYASLFPERAQKVIGEVGRNTRGVKRMLERVGFRYQNHIDPFDGGPHFEAATDEIALIRAYRTARVGKGTGEGPTHDMLCAREAASGRVRFRAVRSGVRFEGGRVFLPEETATLLHVKPGDTVGLVPFSNVEPDGRSPRQRE